MAIAWNPETREFHLRTERLSYILGVLGNGALGQLHFGASLAEGRPYRHLVPREFQGFESRWPSNIRPPEWGTTACLP